MTLHDFFMRLHARRTTGSMMPNVADDPSYRQGYTPSFDDERRISDIVRNKNPVSSVGNPFGGNNAKIDNNYDLSVYSNRKSAYGQRVHFRDPTNDRRDFGGAFFRNPFADVDHLNFASNLDNDFPSYKALTVHNGPFEVFSRPILIQDETSKNKSPTDFGFWADHEPTKYRNTFANHFNRHQDPGVFNNVYKGQGIITRRKQNELVTTGNYDIGKVSRPTFGNSYNFETNGAKFSNKGFKDNSEIWTPVLSTAFRNFGTRLTERSKCKY